jgi:hypothetical protein
MSSTATTPKRLARDIGLSRGDSNDVNSQLCQPEVEITRAIVTTSQLTPCLQKELLVDVKIPSRCRS